MSPSAPTTAAARSPAATCGRVRVLPFAPAARRRWRAGSRPAPYLQTSEFSLPPRPLACNRFRFHPPPTSHSRAGEAALVAAVLGAPATRELLVPALMRVYGQADFVVGLDVDRCGGKGGRGWRCVTFKGRSWGAASRAGHHRPVGLKLSPLMKCCPRLSIPPRDTFDKFSMCHNPRGAAHPLTPTPTPTPNPPPERDTFDKFSMRHDVDMILEELWRDAACRDAIRGVASKQEGARGGAGAGGGCGATPRAATRSARSRPSRRVRARGAQSGASPGARPPGPPSRFPLPPRPRPSPTHPPTPPPPPRPPPPSRVL
jgi:hypothetical protein